MAGNWASWLPALALLALLALLAWGVQWWRQRLQAGGAGGTVLRVVSQLMVGPQQRVVVVELDGPTGTVRLTLGVTPQHVRTLHVQPLGAPPRAGMQPREVPAHEAPNAAAPRYADVVRMLREEPQQREPTP